MPRRIRFGRERSLAEIHKVIPRSRVASTTWYKDNVSKKNFQL